MLFIISKQISIINYAYWKVMFMIKIHPTKICFESINPHPGVFKVLKVIKDVDRFTWENPPKKQ